jgi:periplasmic divalent cation tolerance protein
MTGLWAMFTTVGTRDAADALATAAVQARLAACVQVEAIESVYVWDGTLRRDAEWRLLFKTVAGRREALEALIAERHPYDLPAIWAQRIDDASAGYADWVAANAGGG